MNITTWESLGLTEDEAWADRTPTFTSTGTPTSVIPTSTTLPEWNDGKTAGELEVRLSRSNFHHYDEFSRFLNLTDHQLFTLDALGAIFDAALDAALEEYRDLSNPSRTEILRVFTNYAERTGNVAERIGDQMTRAQMARFDTLSILLVDALEFPASNMASFEGVELTSTQRIAVQGALNDFALNEIDKLVRPNRVSVSQQQTAQRTLETNIRSALSGRALEEWNRAFNENRTLHESVRKHKGLTSGTSTGATGTGATGTSPPVAATPRPQPPAAPAARATPAPPAVPQRSPHQQAVSAVIDRDRSRWQALRGQNSFSSNFVNAGERYINTGSLADLRRFAQVQQRYTGDVIDL